MITTYYKESWKATQYLVQNPEMKLRVTMLSKHNTEKDACKSGSTVK